MKVTLNKVNALICLVSGILLVVLASPHFAEAGGGYGQGSYYGQATYYSQSYYQSYYQSTYYTQSSYQTDFTTDVTMDATLDITGTVSKGSGTFVIDHPLDPINKLLYHSFVESPDVKNIYDGLVVLDDVGEATIMLPDYFEALNKDFRYQYTAYGQSAPRLYVKNEIENNQFTLAGGPPGATVSWQVTGIRKDPFIIANPIVVEVEKGPGELVDKGEYIFTGYESPFNLDGLLERPTSLFGSLWSKFWNWISSLLER